LISAGLPSIFSVVLAAIVAQEVKKIKGIWKHVPTAIMLITLILVKPYFGKFEW
jgi:hypothetical protein